MKNDKGFNLFYSISYGVLFCALLIWFPVNGQTRNSIEQDRGSRVLSGQVNADLQNPLPQRNLRRIVPSEMLELQLVTVPQLTGRNYDLNQITAILDRSGLRLGTAIPVENNDSIGIITGQSPGIRQRVRPQTPVNITYGIPITAVTPSQPQTVRVPEYVGLTLERAVGRMPNDRLVPGNISEINSDNPPGIVVNQFPDAGTPVDPGTVISLEVSIGPPQEFPVRVPNLIGLTLQQAAEVLRGAELFVGTISERISDEREGIIISQSPNPGTEILKGSSVDISYSVRAADVEEERELIPVPDVRQFPRDEAIREIKASRLNYIIDYVNKSGQQNGIVVDQIPQPETLIPPGADVTIFVQDKSGVPPWIYWGGGVLVAGLMGGFIGRKINPGKKKKIVGRKELKLDLKPVLDVGKQSISENENQLFKNSLHFKCISDTGTQTLKTD
jgi:beta-lactam-binding protein with PASTA domain